MLNTGNGSMIHDKNHSESFHSPSPYYASASLWDMNDEISHARISGNNYDEKVQKHVLKVWFEDARTPKALSFANSVHASVMSHDQNCSSTQA